jgi:hypothetical protein
MTKPTAAYIVRAYIVLLCAFALYQIYSYTGIYKWLAEWQLAQFHSYNVRFTLVGTILLPAIPVCLAAEIFGIPYRTGWRASTAPGGRTTSYALWMAVIGVLALIVAAGAFALGYQKSQDVVVTETVDLALAKQPPQSGHVRMTAIARTDMIVRLEERSGSIKVYVPLTAPNWKRSDPITYFLQTNIDAYVGPGGQILSLDPKTPPFRMTQVGVLVPDDLPGPVAESYRKRNLTLASPPMVLETAPGADLVRYWVVAGVSGLLGFFFLLAAGLAKMRQGRTLRPSRSDAV